MALVVAPGRASRALARSPWPGFLARRLTRFAISLAIVFTLVFLTVRLVPGDPVRASLPQTAPASVVEERRADLGLDDALPQQYARALTRALRGDLGSSIVSRKPAGEIVAQRLPQTAKIAALAFLLAVVVAVPLGVLMAVLTRHGRWRGLELGFTATTSLLLTVPDYVVAVALVFLFGVTLGWLPVAGAQGAESAVLPVIALSLGSAAILARLVRIEMLRVLQQEYVRAAESKRLPPPRLYLRHVLPNALTAALTSGGLLLGGLIAGTVIVENVFAWPGLGSAVVDSVQQKDYPLVQAIMLTLGALVLLINLLVDLALALLDPRSIIRDS